jgi:hypothetical protein
MMIFFFADLRLRVILLMLDTRSAGNSDLSNAKSHPHVNGPGALRFRKVEDVKAVVSPEGLVLLHVRRGIFFRANLVGARIWGKLGEGVSVTKIAAELAEEFDAPRDVVAKDVDEFIKSLVDQGFIA